MKTESLVRIFAGAMVLLSVALVYFVSPWWLILTCFVGANLFQSGLTGFCLAGILFEKLGWSRGCCAGNPTKPSKAS